jgi:hypothetical protein
MLVARTSFLFSLARERAGQASDVELYYLLYSYILFYHRP